LTFNARRFIERQIRFLLLAFASMILPEIRLSGILPLHFISERVCDFGHEDSWAAEKFLAGRPAAVPILQEQ